MWMIEVLALAVVVLAGLYLLALGAISLARPGLAGRFLLGFASSRTLHLLEMLLRVVVGGALVCHAPRMALSGAFNLLGWVVLVTTGCLLLVPWRWHQRFARQSVTRALRHITLIGLASLALGGFVLAAMVLGRA